METILLGHEEREILSKQDIANSDDRTQVRSTYIIINLWDWENLWRQVSDNVYALKKVKMAANGGTKKRIWSLTLCKLCK